MSDIFLPANQVWLGFDADGRCIAASIERRKPSLRKGSVMDGCAEVLLCRFSSGQSVFGLKRNEVEVLK